MVKDDYFVIACKILTYYYACLRGDTVFNETNLEKLADRRSISEQYWWYILRNLAEESYLSGIAFKSKFKVENGKYRKKVRN